MFEGSDGRNYMRDSNGNVGEDEHCVAFHVMYI